MTPERYQEIKTKCDATVVEGNIAITQDCGSPPGVKECRELLDEVEQLSGRVTHLLRHVGLRDYLLTRSSKMLKCCEFPGDEYCGTVCLGRHGFCPSCESPSCEGHDENCALAELQADINETLEVSDGSVS